MTKSTAIRPWIALALACSLVWLLNTWLATTGAAATNAVCAALVGLWLIAAIMLALVKHRKPESAVWLMIAGGFVVCAIFVFKMHHLFSYHDLARYPATFSTENMPDGHLGYIAYIVNVGALPTQSPLDPNCSVFYNPPFYHLLQAGFVKLNLLLGINLGATLENLQIFTLFCAGGCMLVSLAILKQIGIGARGQRAGMLMLCFQPMLFIYGATVNNDILSVLLALLCVLFTLRWRENGRMRDIIGIALSLGFGMATKLSVAILIPCVAFVFIASFVKNKPARKRYFKQFAVFLLLSVPVATAWPLYQLIAHQVPLNYVRLPSESINVSRYTLFGRFGLPDSQSIRDLFFNGIRATNHNIWMQTLKTGIFDELILYEKGTLMWYASYLLLVMFAALLLCSLVLFVRMLMRKRDSLPLVSKVFIAGYGALLIASYLRFFVQYPYVSSCNFRYIAPVLTLCALAIACYREDATKRSIWVELYCGSFAALTLVVYGVYLFGARG